jgi:hypothetical protein
VKSNKLSHFERQRDRTNRSHTSPKLIKPTGLEQEKLSKPDSFAFPCVEQTNSELQNQAKVSTSRAGMQGF